jgi:hypothetical protein
MLTIITPSYRQHNLTKLYNSLKFDKIDKWIIVYDTSQNRRYKKLYEGNPKIMEVECNAGISGNPQRNYGIDLVKDGFIYFLDDDNIVHPNFWSIVDSLDVKHFYTFDQLRDKNGKIFFGKNFKRGSIDTAMFIVHKKHIGEIRWVENDYGADYIFINQILNKNNDSHIYISSIGCYYNYLV